MNRPRGIDRRRLLGRAAGGISTLLLSGCNKLSHSAWFTSMLESAETVNRHVQAAITPRETRAREYTDEDLSPHFRSNGTHDPADAGYQALARNGFADWRLELGGLVDRPAHLSLAELRAMPAITQITRHDCVEGWSCIGKWTGVPLGAVLAPLGVQRGARYVMFFCYDRVEGALERYYESIDLAEAQHPQTMLAYAMNDRTLPIPYGAPLRLRLGRQLGYKMAKYLRRIELVESFSRIEGGHGGFYEDNGYEWYAGI
ncbi:MAG TPA: molybdopterin-dependent oxidoreductase [Acetobacteraceae bacterium]|nr:molybdopterin-dependent oxidoreductase [Acetobacteraceae bacterium]